MLRSLVILFGLLAGVSNIASADSNWQPPPHWTVRDVSDPMMVVLWMGERSDDFSPNINVLMDKGHGVAEELMVTLNQFKSARISSKIEKVACTLGAGEKLAYPLHFGNRLLDEVAYLIPDGSGGTYISTYTRLHGTAADPSALLALKQTCDLVR